MDELLKMLWDLVLSPAIALPVACVAFTTIVRLGIAAKWPRFEGSDWYKFVMALVQVALGIGLAFACNGVGLFKDDHGANLPARYMLVAGTVAGFASSWIWSAVKVVAKRRLGLDAASLEDRKARLTKPSSSGGGDQPA